MRKSLPRVTLPVLLVGLGATGYLVFRQGAGPESNEPVIAVEDEQLVVTIGYGDIENVIPAIGLLEPGDVVTARARTSGRIAEIYAAVGEHVEAGQLLALIERDGRPRFAEIEAPRSGTIVSVDQGPGAVLDASESAPAVMQIGDPAAMTVTTGILETDISALDRDVAVYITPFGDTDRRAGRIRQIVPIPERRIGPAVYTVRVDVDNTDGALYPGMTTPVFFVTSTVENVLTVPVGALLPTTSPATPGRATVRIVLPDDSTGVREIVIGARDRVNAEVVSGLAAGERVVAGIVEPRVPDARDGAGYDLLQPPD